MTAPPTATMPCFTKYLEGLVKSVNVFFHEKTRSKEAPHPMGALPSAQRKPSSTASSLSLMSSSRRASRKRPRNSLDVTCCTGRRIVGKESRMETSAAASASAPRLSVEEVAAGVGVFTEEDFRCPPTIAYPKAREGSLYSLLLVDLKGHNSLHARSHRLAWVQHNIPGAAFARGDISAGSVCTPYRPPCARRGSMHVLVLVFEQQHGATLRDVSPVFAEEGLRLSTWLSRFGSAARRMVVCEEFRAHVERSATGNGGDSSDSDACSASSVELGPTTVSFHKLESPKRPKTAATAFVFSEQNGWVPVSASSLAERKGRPLDSPCVSPKHECAKRIKVF